MNSSVNFENMAPNTDDTGVLNSGNDMKVKQFEAEFKEKFSVDASFENIDSLRNAAVELGQKYNCPITTAKSSQENQKITLKCKHGGEYREAKKIVKESESKASDTGDDEVNKKKKTKTSKIGCPCKIVASRPKGSNLVIISQSIFEHNHPIASDLRTYHMHRRLNPETFEWALDLLKRQTPSEVLKVLQSCGIKNVIKKDLENMQQHYRLSDNNGMASFMVHLQKNSYNVRYQTSETSNQISTVFFAHHHGIEELRRFPECIIIDATYKTNSHKYALVNFAISGTVLSKERRTQIVTILVAAAWMDRETASNYTWSLKQLRDIVWGKEQENVELPNVFVTDNDTALRKSLEEVFPESGTLLCYIHVERNFQERFLKNIDKSLSEKRRSELELQHKELIFGLARECISKKQYEDAKKRYITFLEQVDIFQTSEGVQDCKSYFQRMLLEEEHWIGMYANKYFHMNNRSTNRVEGTHSAIKFHNKAFNGNMRSVTDKIDEWYRLREDYRNYQTEKESLSKLVVEIKNRGVVDKMLNPLFGKITHFALEKIKNQLVSGLKKREEDKLEKECTCYTRVWRLPCRHILLELIDKENIVHLDNIHPRWRIHYSVGREVPDLGRNADNCEYFDSSSSLPPSSYQERTQRQFKMAYEDVKNSLDALFDDAKTYQEQQTIIDDLQELLEKVKRESIDSVFSPTVASIVKGRPKKQRRDPVKLEFIKEELRTQDEVPQKRKPAFNDNEIRSSELKKAKLEDQKVRRDVKKHDYHHLIDEISLDIPEDSYTAIIDVRSDGFCGFRAISVQVFGEERFFWKVKQQMRNTLLNNKDFYLKHFSGFIDFQEALNTICYGIETVAGSEKILEDVFPKDESGIPNYQASSGYWFFAPGCAQIAADTFFVPVSVFPTRSNIHVTSATYFPLLEINDSAKIKKKLAQPLILQNIGNIHWVTISIKRSRKLSYPLPDSMYELACRSIGRNPNIKSSSWNHYLSLIPRVKSTLLNTMETAYDLDPETKDYNTTVEVKVDSTDAAIDLIDLTKN